MDRFSFINGQDDRDQNHAHQSEEWAELLARSLGHLAAQLTITQVRLRALATVLSERGGVDEAVVAERVRLIADAELGGYLRENLGEALVELIDVEGLEQDLLAYLSEPAVESPDHSGNGS